MIEAQQPIDALVSEMTPTEKLGQMTQVSNESITPALVADLGIGSILSGGSGNPTPNTPEAWADMVGAFAAAARDTRLGIPLLYGVDAVHGHSNVGGATVFPHNIGLGSAGDADLVARIGKFTATEMLATGVQWAFAPVIAVPQDARWGRTYEGYGRDPDLVSSLGAAAIRGLQGSDPQRASVLACAKHFVGDGATSWDSAPRYDHLDWWNGWGDAWRIDQGDARISEDTLRTVHLAPYASAIAAGVLTVMASYNSWNGAKLHGHRYLLTDVLKGELGFRGFVVSDWMGVDQIAPDYAQAVVTAINAGVDMVMVPFDFRRFMSVMKDATAGGRIPMKRIDDAVRRILRAKRAVGLDDSDAEAPRLDAVGSPEHRALAAEAVQRSLVLLKNDGGLPLRPGAESIAVAGTAADDIGLQCGGWTVGWQGGTGSTTVGTTLLEGLRAAIGPRVEFDPAGRFSRRFGLGIVCLAEPPYAEGPGDRAVPDVSAGDRTLFGRMRELCETLVLVLYSGRPLVIPDLVSSADAVVAAWLPGSEGAALADVLVGRHPFVGRTPQPWPGAAADLGRPSALPLFGTGHGLVGPAADAAAPAVRVT